LPNKRADQALTREIWGQSVYRACLASELATRFAPDHIAEAFIIALMIDSGTPLLNKMCPAELMRVRMQNATPAKQFKAEMESMPCTHVDALLDTKLADVRQRSEQLAALEHELEQLVERSRQLDPADCTEGDICHILKTDR